MGARAGAEGRRLFGLVLAAGRGTRMGGPKALVRAFGAPLVTLHAARLAEAGCARVLVAVRPEVRDALAETGELQATPGVELVAVTTASQAETLDAALAHLRARAASEGAAVDAARDLVVVTPVDLVPPSLATLHALVHALEASGDARDAATPTFEGRGGHPVVVRLGALAPADGAGAGAASGAPLRDRLAGLGARRVRVPVADPAVAGDFDRPEHLPAR